MPDPDYKALCAELVKALDDWQLGGGPPEDTADADLILRARAALAQPEPVGVTDEEIDEWQSHCAYLTRSVACGGAGTGEHYWAFDVESDHVASIVRAALARWGRPAIQPVPVADPEAASQWPAHWSRAQREREAQSLCLQAGIDPVQQKRLCRYARDGMPLQDIHDLIAAEPDSRPSQEVL